MGTETKGINLLPHADELSLRRRKLARSVQILLLVVMGGLGVIWISLNAVTIIASSNLASEEQRISAQQQVLTGQSAKEQRFQLLADRLGEASRLLRERPPIKERIRHMIELLPSGSQLVDLSVEGNGSLVELTVSTVTIDGFERLIQSLTQSDPPSVVLTRLERLADGTYQLSLAIRSVL